MDCLWDPSRPGYKIDQYQILQLPYLPLAVPTVVGKHLSPSSSRHLLGAGCTSINREATKQDKDPSHTHTHPLHSTLEPRTSGTCKAPAGKTSHFPATATIKSRTPKTYHLAGDLPRLHANILSSRALFHSRIRRKCRLSPTVVQRLCYSTIIYSPLFFHSAHHLRYQPS
jgi:hypothetical protein